MVMVLVSLPHPLKDIWGRQVVRLVITWKSELLSKSEEDLGGSRYTSRHY